MLELQLELQKEYNDISDLITNIINSLYDEIELISDKINNLITEYDYYDGYYDNEMTYNRFSNIYSSMQDNNYDEAFNLYIDLQDRMQKLWDINIANKVKHLPIDIQNKFKEEYFEPIPNDFNKILRKQRRF